MFEMDTVTGCCWISISTLNFRLSPIDCHCNFVNNVILREMYSTPFHPPPLNLSLWWKLSALLSYFYKLLLYTSLNMNCLGMQELKIVLLQHSFPIVNIIIKPWNNPVFKRDQFSKPPQWQGALTRCQQTSDILTLNESAQNFTKIV